LLFEDSGPKPANLDGQYNYIWNLQYVNVDAFIYKP
jgi:hypothetical protein